MEDPELGHHVDPRFVTEVQVPEVYFVSPSRTPPQQPSVYRVSNGATLKVLTPRDKTSRSKLRDKSLPPESRIRDEIVALFAQRGICHFKQQLLGER